MPTETNIMHIQNFALGIINTCAFVAFHVDVVENNDIQQAIRLGVIEIYGGLKTRLVDQTVDLTKVYRYTEHRSTLELIKGINNMCMEVATRHDRSHIEDAVVLDVMQNLLEACGILKDTIEKYLK